MANPLYKILTSQTPNNNIIARFNEFRQNFKGNPQEKVQELLNSGKVSQAQYNQAVQIAQQFQKMLG